MLNLNELDDLITNNVHYISGPVKQRMLRFKALCSKEKSELEAIYYLVESHVPSLMFKANSVFEIYRHPSSNKNHMHTQCSSTEVQTKISIMQKQLREMPPEWTFIQLTPQFNSSENIKWDINKAYTLSLYLTVFYCGKKQPDPFLIEIEAPRDVINGQPVELSLEMNSIIKDSKGLLSGVKQVKKFTNVSEKSAYYSKRKKIDDRLKGLVKDLQDMYIKEWRVLFLGKYENHAVEEKIRLRVENFFKNKEVSGVSDKTKILIQYLIKGIHYLQTKELARAVYFLFPTDSNLQNSIKQFIRSVSDELNIPNEKRYPVILIVDDALDLYPWEMLNVFAEQSVSRLPSLSIAYSLFKEHESSIKNGFKIIKDPSNGRYLLNPGENLLSMENRLSSFYDYWIPSWKGIVGVTPTEEQFKDMLLTGSIFAYSGHGSGVQYLAMEKIQKMNIGAVVFLFGCSSSKLISLGPQTEMYGTYQMYLIAQSPCVVGMLWEVTDLDTDVFTTEFFSKWIPNDDNCCWSALDKSKWQKGEKVNFSEQNIDTSKHFNIHEPELLKALYFTKNSGKLSFYLTSAAAVARGIPVKINRAP